MAMGPVSVGYLILTLVQVTDEERVQLNNFDRVLDAESRLDLLSPTRREIDYGGMGESNADSERDGSGDLDPS